ncbi:hypothetical protein OB2597_18846 [Pseudooceanicola batsensis HTCC2597]|uniref:Uncharacterized protein n=1 Tax=Pseudooceanicola batsensis (strain ATCC BAA-863 / DSM 15984 / KCTC 12145 / HTCC2597) TaxID=252305 RepID=A3U4B0_PSEBH|nr:hypothetical protein OB2597_18846 [Pseudooceanicola batsensis HTCC2597]
MTIDAKVRHAVVRIDLLLRNSFIIELCVVELEKELIALVVLTQEGWL